MQEQTTVSEQTRELQTEPMAASNVDSAIQPPGSAKSKALKNTLGKYQDVLALSSQEMSNIEKFSSLEDRRFKMEMVLKTWETQQTEERKLRKFYARGILWLLVGEMLVGNTIFILIGLDILKFPEWVVQTFFVGMYTQIVGMVMVVVKGLFPTPQKDTSTQLHEMVEKL